VSKDGNAAVSQFQGGLEWICDNWHLPDTGIWEMRNRREHFVYSKVMNSVALGSQWVLCW